MLQDFFSLNKKLSKTCSKAIFFWLRLWQTYARVPYRDSHFPSIREFGVHNCLQKRANGTGDSLGKAFIFKFITELLRRACQALHFYGFNRKTVDRPIEFKNFSPTISHWWLICLDKRLFRCNIDLIRLKNKPPCGANQRDDNYRRKVRKIVPCLNSSKINWNEHLSKF